MSTAQGERAMQSLTRNWGGLLALGALMLVLGVVVIARPAPATFAFQLLLGWALVIGGLAHGVHAFMVKGWRGFLFELLSGLLYLLVGVMILANPLGGALTLTMLLAMFLVVEGIFKIFTGFRARPLNGWVWLVVSGVVTLILGVLIWAEWPSSALWVIGLLVGIHLILTGWSLILLALAARVAGGRVSTS
jgi:uncharacterized membrane protein HdeD (DUF308 family)